MEKREQELRTELIEKYSKSIIKTIGRFEKMFKEDIEKEDNIYAKYALATFSLITDDFDYLQLKALFNGNDISTIKTKPDDYDYRRAQKLLKEED